MESLDRSNIKKILLTTTGLSSVGQGGGISSYVHDLATNFVNKGYKVTVYLVRQNLFFLLQVYMTILFFKFQIKDAMNLF